MRKPLDYYLIKLNRIFVWFLLLFMILLVITGYALAKPGLISYLTGGLINYQNAAYLHTLLDVPLLIFLLVHVVIEVKFSLTRWGFKSRGLLNLLMLLLGAVVLVAILYVDSVG